jgi:hypothetical protein
MVKQRFKINYTHHLFIVLSWGSRWAAPTQAVAVLATLGAVTHGEGVTLGHSERGNIIVALVAQNQRSDCTEMLGNMVSTGDHVVGVSCEGGISDLHHLGHYNGKANAHFFAQFYMPSHTAATVYAFVNQDLS